MQIKYVLHDIHDADIKVYEVDTMHDVTSKVCKLTYTGRKHIKVYEKVEGVCNGCGDFYTLNHKFDIIVGGYDNE